MNNDFDIDDFLNDDNAFKPVTEGLGFHHGVKSKKELKQDLKKQSLDLKKDLDLRAKQLKEKESVVSDSFSTQSHQATDMGELAPFYTNTKKAPQDKLDFGQLDEVGETYFDRPSHFGLRLAAYIIDVSLILSCLSLSLYLAISTSGLSFDTVKSDSMIITLTAILSFLCYTLYFSFFDRTAFSTFGKRVFSLRLKAEEGELSFGLTFLRASLSLISLFTLGIFSILKLEDRMAKSYISKANDE